MTAIEVYFKNNVNKRFNDVSFFQEPSDKSPLMLITYRGSWDTIRDAVIPFENVSYYEIVK